MRRRFCFDCDGGVDVDDAAGVDGDCCRCARFVDTSPVFNGWLDGSGGIDSDSDDCDGDTGDDGDRRTGDCDGCAGVDGDDGPGDARSDRLSSPSVATRTPPG